MLKGFLLLNKISTILVSLSRLREKGFDKVLEKPRDKNSWRFCLENIRR
jgi:hypothetical protein